MNIKAYRWTYVVPALGGVVSYRVAVLCGSAEEISDTSDLKYDKWDACVASDNTSGSTGDSHSKGCPELCLAQNAQTARRDGLSCRTFN